MMENKEETSVELTNIFDKAFKLFLQLESSSNPTNSKEYQNEIKTVKKLLEVTTQMVNEIGVFSQNEEIEEVATADIKYLLLPALLGSVTTRITNTSRLELLDISEIYFRDFLQRCNDYGISDIIIPESSDSMKDLMPNSIDSMAQKRQNKIEQYKRRKEIEKKLEELKIAVEKQNTEDETKREYYLLSVKKWIDTALEELHSINSEKLILKQMPFSKEHKDTANEVSVRKPLTPIIITKNELQKKVFGLGYPSIPTMTVDEFYHQKYGQEKQATPTTINSLQDMADNPEKAAQRKDKEDEEKEHKEENEDSQYLKERREWDDWKDDHRRGSGNRKNMG